MNKGKKVGFQSALLVNKYVIASAFILSLIAWWLSADLIAVVLLTVSAVGLISLIWGSLALNNVDVNVDAQSSFISVGQSVEFNYVISNNKSLPLVWLEICQDVPFNDCMIPDNNMTLREFSEDEAVYSGRKSAYMRRLAFLMGNTEISFKCVWSGNKRGIYRPSDIVIRSGDGFGLTQIVGTVKGIKGRVFAVWPKIIPVNTSALLKNIWNGKTGRNGWAEDISVLKDEREYREGDSFKRIDWRYAARSGELYTKQFEMTRPQSFIFIIDTFSISDKEEALSIVASVIIELKNQEIAAGIALPATKSKAPVLLRPDDPSVTVEACMYEISDHDALSAREDGFNIRNILTASESSGKVWFITEDKKSALKSAMYRALAFSSPSLLLADRDTEALSFDNIRSKEAAS